MERIMSVEDKIRRAEEIYYRRKEKDFPLKENLIQKCEKKEKKENKHYIKKMVIQIIICTLIYSVFYLLNNNDYIISESIIKKTKEILEKDINFPQITSFFEGFIKLDEKENEGEEEKLYQDIQNNNENIGGAEEDETPELEQTVETNTDTENSEMSQMEIDANYIKEAIEFVKPLENRNNKFNIWIKKSNNCNSS